MLFSAFKVVKNLLFVAKVIYLLHPEEENTENHQEEKDNESVQQEASGGEEDNADRQMEEEKSATLMWLVRKLSILAKKEAAHTPKNPLKVSLF